MARDDSFAQAVVRAADRLPPAFCQTKALAHFPLASPAAGVSDRIANAFGHSVQQLFVRAACAVRESRTLATLRDALLPKLISGELRVKDVERVAAKAAS